MLGPSRNAGIQKRSNSIRSSLPLHQPIPTQPMMHSHILNSLEKEAEKPESDKEAGKLESEKEAENLESEKEAEKLESEQNRAQE